MDAIDQHLLRIAAGQHGVFTAVQAHAAGLSANLVDNRLRSGRWDRVARGVYRCPGSPRSWRQRLHAALLAAPGDAAFSHASAAALWRLPGFPEGPVELTVPRHRSPRGALSTVHRAALPSTHVRLVEGLRVTSPARTLFDLAASLPAARLARAVDNAWAMKLVTWEGLAAMSEYFAGSGRAGLRKMGDVLHERGPGHVPPASELERRFLALVERGGLPPPARQAAVGSRDAAVGRVDFVYRHARLIVEVDGRRWHASMLDAEEDRRRDAEAAAGGWRVLRFGWADVTERPGEVVRRLAAAIGAAV